MRLLLLVAAFAVSAPAWPAGQDGGRGAGFIAGQVVDIPGGKGIPEAGVALFGGPTAQAPGVRIGQVVTDAQGRFFFANLPPGSYQLSTNKAGYVAPRTSGPPLFELANGERITNAVARLMKLASLSGTLRDEAGDPVVGTDVVVLQRYVDSGREVFGGVAGSRSDDRGQYRAGGLTPGDYVVCACPSHDLMPFDGTLLTTLASEPLQLMAVDARALTVGSDVVSLDNTLRTYPPTLHPNSATLARATKVTLAPGEERIGIDINLPFVRSTRVSGAITGATSPVQAGSIRLVRAVDNELRADFLSLQPMLVQADGRFDFAMVPPGQYRLIVVHRETGARSGGPSGPSSPQDTHLWASQPIAVGENGVTGLVIPLNRGPIISGRVQWIGAAPPPPPQMVQHASVIVQSAVVSDPLTAQLTTAVVRVTPDATFMTPATVPGKWIISATPLPGYPTLKSITVGGLDITDMALEVGDKDVSEVVLTYVDTPMASLTVVSGPAPPGPPPADDPAILVFPVDRKYWTEPVASIRRFRTWMVTPAGTTTTPDLPAGEYFVVRVGSLEAADWMEASKLDGLSKRGQRVTVPEAGTARIEVRR